MLEKELNNVKILPGYDTNGVVYDAGEFVLRKINPNYADSVMQIYGCNNEYKLEEYGIVETDLMSEKTSDEIVLRHKKYVITYPYEWSPTMFRDAALFHIKLFLNLDRHKLTLKDALPNNVLFDSYNPVFVDFLSMVFTDKLKEEEWLACEGYSEPRFAVFDKMFLPYFFIPLLVMLKKEYPLARKILFEKACNCDGGVPCWRDLLSISNKKSIAGFTKLVMALKLLYGINTHRRLYENRSDGFVKFCKYLLEVVETMAVAPTQSAYASYYEEKKENFHIANQSKWKDKQKSVHTVLERIKPKRVLDIGSNTGWFSTLAESMGAQVIAADIDESSVDVLYRYAKINKLKIIPLLLSFDGINREIYGVVDKKPVYEGRDFQSTPLYMAATKRLKSDIVLVLGLIHHLVLGEGRELDDIFDILSQLTVKTLVLEFIGLDDAMIKGEPSFFKNLGRYTEDSYSLETVVNAGKKQFKSVEIMNSHPDTRKVLVFSR